MKSKKNRTMKHICLLLCLFSASFFVFGFLNEPSIASIALSDNFKVGVWNIGFDSRLLFFNDEEYNPSNLALNIAGDTIKKTFYLSRVPGLYYRYIQTDLDAHWLLLVSPWYPIGIFGFWVIYFQLRETFYKNIPGKTDDIKETEGQP